MKAFRQGTAPAAQFDNNGMKLWEFSYSEQYGAPGGHHKSCMIVETDDSHIQEMLLQAGAVEVAA